MNNQTRPRMLIISFSAIASDARVLKQVRHFAKSYDVTTCGYGPSPTDDVTHISIPDDRPFYAHSRMDLILRRFRSMYINSPAVKFARDRLTLLPAFEIVIANDIDTVGLALDLRGTKGVHADIHEYAPRQNDEIFMWRMFIAPYVRWMCRRFLTQATSVTTVGHGVAGEYRRVYGIDAGIVTNSAPYADLTPTPVSEPIKVVHSGAALRNRRLETMIEAVQRSRNSLTLDLYLMQNDPSYLEELRALAARDDRVRIKDPVPYSELLQTLNAYDLGIHIIPPVNFNSEWSLPNKFFDYVQARIGLVIGPSPEMRENLERYGLGVTAVGFGTDDVVSTLDQLAPSDVSEWKANAHSAALALSAEEQVAVWDRAVATISRAAAET